jgi:hypothetical protein
MTMSVAKWSLAGLLAISSPSFAESDDVATLVSDKVRIQRLTLDFEQSLAQLGLKARLSCTHMVEVLGSGRGGSFGAICTLNGIQKSRQIMLCDDFMIGKLTFKASGFVLSDNEVISFTRLNCPTGG